MWAYMYTSGIRHERLELPAIEKKKGNEEDRMLYYIYGINISSK